MRTKLVAANWKMNGGLAANAQLLEGLRAAWVAPPPVEVAICPPYPYLAQAQALLAGSSISWGAQNVSQHAAGAYTGEVSAAMLNDFACKYVIVGHSERRILYNESDLLVAEKFAAARQHGLAPILCVGELLEEREAGQANAVVARQLTAVIRHCGIRQLQDCVVAYEPVWAIGTGRTATAAQAQEMHALIRRLVAREDAGVAASLRILYGGSVKPDNAGELFALPDVDGGLVGGASLNANDFLAICRAGAAASLNEA